jgi:tetratricopeptide (TPR) repeat protein
MVATALAAACLAVANSASATREKSTQLALEAKEALDAHFGNPAQLAKAAALLTRALDEDETDPTIYVQAARLTVKGGHVVATRFRPGTIDAYGELLDRALSLDPKNPKALILKAEYFYYRGDYASERSSLDKAKETGTRDSWLLIGYGRHYRRAGDARQAFSSYSEARQRGVGSTLEQRNAYIASLSMLAGYAAISQDMRTLKDLVDLTRKERDPRDAWALGNLAEQLIHAGVFDEAIALSREALATMNYGAGRLALTAALYGKAAELTAEGDQKGAAPFLQEARSYGFDRASVLDRFARGNGEIVTQLLPTIEALVN